MALVSRVDLEEREHVLLGPLGRLSVESLGRAVPEEPDPLRTCFQCDRDRILHSKSFRRLAHKTQVFLAPEGTTTARGSSTPSRWPRWLDPSRGRSGSTRT